MNAAGLSKKLLGVPVVTKSRTGFLIAQVTIGTIVGEAAITGIDFLSRNDTLACTGLGLLGFVSWFAGRVCEARRAESTPVQDAPDGEAVAEEHPLAFLKSPKSWGVILVVLAGILSCLAVWRRHEPAPVVRARPLPAAIITVTNVVTNFVTITNVAPRLVFPSLELQGVVVNGAKSSALINGRVLYLGEGISNAVLVAVDAGRALVAMEGQTNALVLRR
jgi:hypothetical protein